MARKTARKGRTANATKATSASRRIRQYPKNPLPAQHQRKPGQEHALRPRPQYEAPHYRAAGKLAGLTALVTGGDSGIGRAVAVLYAKEGADVAITHLPEEQRDAEETRAAIEAEGRRCVLLAGRPVEESLNLQFCHIIINYDIPWDPSRLEQRTGRVHRLGQLYDVSIHSLVSKDTYVEHLLSLYRQYLRLFELEVGELGMVLDEMDEAFNFERELWELWLKYPDPVARTGMLTQIGNKLAQARSDFEHSMRGAAAINDIFEG